MKEILRILAGLGLIIIGAAVFVGAMLAFLWAAPYIPELIKDAAVWALIAWCVSALLHISYLFGKDIIK